MKPSESNRVIAAPLEEPTVANYSEKLEALADAFELLSIAFSFPSSEIAEALASGDFQADLNACLKELGIRESFKLDCSQSLEDLYACMKREYSRLYLSPGKLQVIYPYESAFLFHAQGGEGFPSLMSNTLTVEVEKHMREAQALPKTARVVPVDSVSGELDFMRHLYTHAYGCACLKDSAAPEALSLWLERARAFQDQHISPWLPAFMRATQEHARVATYRKLAQVGEVLVSFSL